jgi:hypothetical protein
VQSPLLQAFPFPNTLGEVSLYPHSVAGLFIYTSRGCDPSPFSCGVFLPPPLLQAFTLLVPGWVPPLLLPSPAGLFIYNSMRDFFSPPLRQSGCPALFAMCFFFFFQLLVYYSVCFFPMGGSQSVQGAMLIWPRFVCGSNTCCLAHMVVCFSQAG